jgi:hypothetical protein
LCYVDLGGTVLVIEPRTAQLATNAHSVTRIIAESLDMWRIFWNSSGEIRAHI